MIEAEFSHQMKAVERRTIICKVCIFKEHKILPFLKFAGDVISLFIELYNCFVRKAFCNFSIDLIYVAKVSAVKNNTFWKIYW